MTIDLSAHLMNLKGKSYLPVAPRIVAFRETRPDWAIVTDPVTIGDAWYCRASIIDDAGRIHATAHKSVTSFAGGAFEKAETGAIGRALSLCGYGTLLALDMDEGDDIADAPVAQPAKPAAVPAEALDMLAAIEGAATEDELRGLGPAIKMLPPKAQQSLRDPFGRRLAALRGDV